jgi:hypothetical protein
MKYPRNSVVRSSIFRSPDYRGENSNRSAGKGERITYFDDKGGRNFGPKQKRSLLPLIEEFDDKKTYKPWELDMFADAWLVRDFDKRRNFDEPVILLEEHELERRKREIYVYSGVPGEEVLDGFTSPDGQRMYWRTHPGGRKVNSLEQRRGNKASFYR